MTDKENTVVFIDHIGRNIIGRLVEETETTLKVVNPIILHCQPQASGQLEVQTFPLFFVEFIDKEHRDTNAWTYQKANIVKSDAVLDDRMLSQYEKINTPKEQAPQESPKVISIEDL